MRRYKIKEIEKLRDILKKDVYRSGERTATLRAENIAKLIGMDYTAILGFGRGSIIRPRTVNMDKLMNYYSAQMNQDTSTTPPLDLSLPIEPGRAKQQPSIVELQPPAPPQERPKQPTRTWLVYLIIALLGIVVGILVPHLSIDFK